MKRIIIVGTTGCGKTTVGKALSKKLGISFTDLDDLFWLPNWTPRPWEEFTQLIQEKTSSPTWIISGNQSKTRYLFWAKADTIIWLDLPFYLIFYQILKRSFVQSISREKICNGNKQTFKQFFWLIRWLFSSFFRRRKTYQALCYSEEKKSSRWIHLKSRRQVNQFLFYSSEK